MVDWGDLSTIYACGRPRSNQEVILGYRVDKLWKDHPYSRKKDWVNRSPPQQTLTHHWSLSFLKQMWIWLLHHFRWKVVLAKGVGFYAQWEHTDRTEATWTWRVSNVTVYCTEMYGGNGGRSVTRAEEFFSATDTRYFGLIGNHQKFS